MIKTFISKVRMREGIKGTWHLDIVYKWSGDIHEILTGTEDEVRAKKVQLEVFLLRSH